ncbi:hypothetical protein Syun_014505 [Stephania yunnanensis]|uniref:Uncharacterized protein n=1 Tax=Stephania yunnanensis TaxID=152371 RepID=A0AAP0PBW9_9MAGN
MSILRCRCHYSSLSHLILPISRSLSSTLNIYLSRIIIIISLPSSSVLSFIVKYISSISLSLVNTNMVRSSNESKMRFQFRISIKKGLDLIFSISRLEALTHIFLNHASHLT